MTIIVEGKLDNLKVNKFECPRCGCVFAANEMEYRVLGKFDGEYYILEHACPCCGLEIQVTDTRKHYW